MTAFIIFMNIYILPILIYKEEKPIKTVVKNK